MLGRPDQVKSEIKGFLKMLDEVYAVFGLEYSLKLSTRPDGFLGDEALWDKAEAALEEALNETGRPWEVRSCGCM